MIFPTQHKAKLAFADRIQSGEPAAVKHIAELFERFKDDVPGCVDVLSDPQWAPNPPPVSASGILNAFQSTTTEWDSEGRLRFANLIREIANDAHTTPTPKQELQ